MAFSYADADCVFNEKKDKQAFILENRTNNETFVVYSDRRYMDVGQKLVKMLHGDKILETTSKPKAPRNETIKTIIMKAKELNKKNSHWHHHMFFPDCIFNQHQGKWNITFEDKEASQTFEALYNHEPVNDLKEIKVLYYQQKK